MKKLFAILIFVLPSTLCLGGNHSGIGPGGTPIVAPVTGPGNAPGRQIPAARIQDQQNSARYSDRSAARPSEGQAVSASPSRSLSRGPR